MTREQKLALIIGFSVFMVVGVLVGDYFSKARTARLDTGLAGNMGVQEPDPRPIGGATILPVNHRNIEPAHDTLPPVIFDQGEGAKPATKTDEINTAPQVAPSATDVATHPYTVKKGDALEKIAKTEYGDAKLWKKLAEFNKDTLKGGINLSEGMIIKLPEKDFLLGKPAKPTTPVRDNAQGDKPLPTSPINTPRDNAAGNKKTELARSYTVKPGDTLAKIARTECGDEKLWKKIAELNKDTLPRSEDLKVGAVLKLPTK